MGDDLHDVVRGLPDEAFSERDSGFASLSPLERLRWLQQTAHFVWRFKGAARRPRTSDQEVVERDAPKAD